MSPGAALDATRLTLVLGGALWGALTGALLPRAAHRFAVPAGQAWAVDCPKGHPIRGWAGPAVCPEESGERYGPAAPALSLACALVCALLAAATGPRPELGVWLLLAPLGVLLFRTDLRVQRLPDPLTLPAAALAALLLGAAALLPGHGGSWTGALLGGAALAGGYFVMFLVSPAGMGFGDVKLALSLGLVLGWYGWGVLLLGTFAGFVLAGLYGLVLVALRRAGRRTAIPFGPFLLAGAFLGLATGALAA
ncbi:prepilin peptidase [Streptomyces sp. NPDC007088]|uniref:prepilin peptidase n=1 Tax=Streptomyces sp. NPDC007088 TaxID=3364773 RepID=UPI00368C1E03